MPAASSSDKRVPHRVTELSLENFKAFGRRQKVPLAPLTLVFGPNSAGKSSIVHGLGLLAHLAADGNPDDVVMRIGSEELRLGGVERFIHAGGTHFSLGVELQPARDVQASFVSSSEWRSLRIELGFRMDREHSAVGVADAEAFSPWVEPTLVAIALDGAPVMTLRVEAGPGDLPYTYTVTELNEVHQFWRRLPSGARGKVRESVEAVLASASGPYPDQQAWWPALVAPRETDDGLPPGFTQVAALLADVSRAAKSCLRSVALVGSLRPVPSQEASASELRDTVWAPLLSSDAVRRSVNRWLASDANGTPYRLDVALRFDGDELERALQHGSASAELPPTLADLVARIDGAEPPARADAETAFRKLILAMKAQRYLRLVDRRTEQAVAFENVGAGVSQFLPVLVAALGSSGRLLAIQQPELHLHPRLQTAIGDVFIESALGDRENTLLLETHSEHLILRILRRIRETTEGSLPKDMPPVSPEDVSVLYVRPGHDAKELTGGGAHVERIPITPEGMFAGPWPGGFFDERLEELL